MVYLVTFGNPSRDKNGVAGHILDLKRGLEAQGQEVGIICPDDRFLGWFPFTRGMANVVKKLCFRSKSELLLVLHLWFQSRILRKKLKRISGGDHVVNCQDMVSLHALRGARITCRRKVLTVHFAIAPWEEFVRADYFREDSPVYRVFSDRLRAAFSIEDLHVVTVSKMSNDLYKTLRPDYADYRQKLWVIYPGLDRAVPSSGAAIPPEVPASDYIINVGLLSETKSQLILAEIALEFKKKGSTKKFVCIGSSENDYKERLLQYVRDNGLEDTFLLTGPIPRDSVFKIVAGADLMVHTSNRENLCMVLVESMGLGCPVTAFQYPSLKEILQETPEVMWDRTVPRAEIADKLLALLDDKAALLSLKERQFAAYEERFTFQTMITSFLAVYEKG